MRKFSDKTQFLVITHRRGTMEEADLLYGVTMQEKGISTVLTLDLEEARKTIED
jgi:chromosome segregation protein